MSVSAELRGGTGKPGKGGAHSPGGTPALGWAKLVTQLRAALMFRHLTKTHSFRRAVSASRLAEVRIVGTRSCSLELSCLLGSHKRYGVRHRVSARKRVHVGCRHVC